MAAPAGTPDWFRLVEVAALLGLMAVLPDLAVLGDDVVWNYVLFLGCVTGIGLFFRNVMRGE
jgi:hypothetical protein